MSPIIPRKFLALWASQWTLRSCCQEGIKRMASSFSHSWGHLCHTFPFSKSGVLESYEGGEPITECKCHLSLRSPVREFDINCFSYGSMTSKLLYMVRMHLIESFLV